MAQKIINIPNKIIIVENSEGQGYIVTKPEQLQSAKNWGDGYIYGQGDTCAERTANGHKFDAIINEYDNGKFLLEIKEAAQYSSNNGKLSFWNCNIIAPDDKEYLIGINSEVLCELIKHITLVNGKSKEWVYLGRSGNQQGAYTEDCPDYKLYLDQVKIKEKNQKEATTKYDIGDVVGTMTTQYLYLGPIYEQYNLTETYEFVNYNGRWGRMYHNTLTKHKKPIKKHIFIPLDKEYQIKYKFLYDSDIKIKKPKYAILDHISVDQQSLLMNFWEQNKIPLLRFKLDFVDIDSELISDTLTEHYKQCAERGLCHEKFYLYIQEE